MKHLSISLSGVMFALAVTLPVSAAGLREKTADAPLENAAEVLKVPLADPFIMLYGDTYYAYGTSDADGIPVYTSKDLITWSRAQGLAKGGLALHKDDVWGDRWFWAPEVYCFDGRFHMYYSADEHICAATANSPLGPFVQEVRQPLIEGEKCIDNTLFVDDDGKAYMYFDRFNDGLNIWVAEMEDDYLTMKEGTMRKCINVSQDWENVWPRVNEGCFVVRRGDIYYMTYSGNSYESPNYGIGCATSSSPLGPWVKYDHNPLLQFPFDLVGTGHSAMFRDRAGNLKIVFHAHKDRENIHPREMYIGDVYFLTADDGHDVMYLTDGFLTPRMAE